MTDNLALDPSPAPIDRPPMLARISNDLKLALANAELIDDALLCARIHVALDRVTALQQDC